MNDSIAVTGILTGYRTAVDGGLKITIELDEAQAARFHDGFHGVGFTVVVARLREKSDES